MRRAFASAAGAVAATAALAAAAALCGCGSAPADLFAVTRAPAPGGGATAMAPLTLVVSDDGSVICDRRRAALPGPLLLQARQLQRDLQPIVRAGTRLAPGSRPVYTYAVRTPDGSAGFADDSPGQPKALSQLVYLTLQIDEQVCRR